MIEKAKEMVREAVELQEEWEVSSAAAKKRRTEEDDEDKEARALLAKRVKAAEEKLKRRNRALVGVTAAFALA
jgi:hypothetical protein